ncbi:root allergen protein-like [Rutidosis leptorrhynchoides]|uniref:root allergen protein-like n=1 Tax=Rutidosis leptorrhynchoides TaxID=125765 RepID=UPI003A999D88
MAVVSNEIEIVHALPADDLFQIITNFHELAPKAAPEIYKSITVEGEIVVGTIQSNVYGDGVPFTSSKQKFDVVDLPNRYVSFTIYEGDILADYLESITHHLKILPSADGGSVYKHTIEYKCKGDVKPTEEYLSKAKEGITGVFKAIEAYVTANA